MKCNVEAMLRRVSLHRYFSENGSDGFARTYRGYYEGSLDAAAAMLCIDRVEVRIITKNILEIGKLQGKGPNSVELPTGWVRKQVVAAQKECARLDAQRGIPAYNIQKGA